MIEEVITTVGEELKNETRERISKVWKRAIAISFILNIVFICSTIFAIRDRSSLAEGLAETKELIVELESRNKTAETALGIARGELKEAIKTIDGLKTIRIELETTIEQYAGATGGVSNSTTSFESIDRELAEILSRYDTGSGEDRETKQDTEN